MTRNIKITIATCVCLLSVASSFAFGFHGGTINDIQNRIKEEVLKLKDSEIAQKFNELKELQKTYNEQFKELAKYKEDINHTISNLRGLTKEAGGILDEPKKARNELKDLYTFEFLNDENNLTFKGVSSDIADKHEAENTSTFTRANQLNEITQDINAEMEKVMKDYSDGVISEQQKNLLLQSLLLQSKNANALTKNQMTLNTIYNDASQSAENKIATGVSKEQSFQLNTDEAHKQRIKELQLNALPR